MFTNVQAGFIPKMCIRMRLTIDTIIFQFTIQTSIESKYFLNFVRE